MSLAWEGGSLKGGAGRMAEKSTICPEGKGKSNEDTSQKA